MAASGGIVPDSVAADEMNAERAVLDYAAKFNKSYKSKKEMDVRADNYKKSVAKRSEDKKKNPRATFGDTPLSDLSEEEFKAMLGTRPEGDRRVLAATPEAHGRSL